MNDIKTKRDAMAKRYVESSRHTIQVDWVPFMDEIADMIGCQPNLGKAILLHRVISTPTLDAWKVHASYINYIKSSFGRSNDMSQMGEDNICSTLNLRD